jgi:diguanylate cyclase (GGDEF)-like protein/PAS domain S-box-containing protein
MLETLYKEILDSIYDGVYFVDTDRRITYWNRGAARISGFSAEAVIGHKCSDCILRHVDIHGRQLCTDGCPLTATIADGKAREEEVFLHHRDGYRLAVLVRVSALRNTDGTIIGATEVFSDNSAMMVTIKHLRALSRQANQDSLTGIGNRRYIEEKIAYLLAESRTSRVPCGLLLFDIDRFKTVNDNFGHDVGDAVLKEIAHTASRSFRETDFLGRWGGEEFVALLQYVTVEQLSAAAENLRHRIQELVTETAGQKIGVTVSIGATTTHPDDCVLDLVKRADLLMYMSKQAGGNNVIVLPHPLSSREHDGYA